MFPRRTIGFGVAAAVGLVVLFVAGKAWLGGQDDAAGGRQSIRSEDVRAGRVVVVGRLGVPLGTVVEVAATVGEVSGGGSVRPFSYELIVAKVGDARLAVPERFRFEVAAANFARLVASHSEMDALVRVMTTEGEKQIVSGGEAVTMPPISAAEAERFPKEYVGSVRRLLVFESGTWGGAPKNWPAEFGLIAPRENFEFRTILHVIAER